MNITNNVDVEKIDDAIRLLDIYVKDSSIEPLISILKELKQDPENTQLVVQLSETLKGLGIIQGAILTYAPYISVLISDDPFGNS